MQSHRHRRHRRRAALKRHQSHRTDERFYQKR